MPEMKTLNGYEIVDAKAREDIVALQEAVENMPEGGGGSEKTVVEFYWSADNVDFDLLTEAYSYATAGNNVFDKYDFLYRHSPVARHTARVLFVTCKDNCIKAVMYDPALSDTAHMYEYTYDLSNKTSSIYEITMLNSNNYSNYISSSGGGSNWVFTTDFYDSNLYNASEVYIMLRCSSQEMNIFSHVMFNQNNSEYHLGQNQYKHFAFTTPDGIDYQTPYWTYSGSCIDIYDGGEYELRFIAYKVV